MHTYNAITPQASWSIQLQPVHHASCAHVLGRRGDVRVGWLGLRDIIEAGEGDSDGHVALAEPRVHKLQQCSGLEWAGAVPGVIEWEGAIRVDQNGPGRYQWTRMVTGSAPAHSIGNLPCPL